MNDFVLIAAATFARSAAWFSVGFLAVLNVALAIVL